MKGKRNIPKVPKVAKTAAKKPPTVPKVAKTAKAVAKKPPTVPTVAKTAKAVAKKPKINVSCSGGMFCIGLYCGSKVGDVYDPQPVLTQPVLTQPVSTQPVSTQPLALEQLEKRIDKYLLINKKITLYYHQEFQKKNITEYIDIKEDSISKKIKPFEGIYLENVLMESIRDKIILNMKSRHFQIMYYFSEFNSICHNEVVKGNISFTSQSKSELNCESLINILIQSFISVGSFHNLVGYIHKDCKCENFLYQINDDTDTNGYYAYNLEGEKYYLKSCRYNVMISNFEKPIKFIKGMSEQDAENNTDATLILKDYIKIFEDFTEHKNLRDVSEYDIFKGKLNTYMGNFSKKLQGLYSVMYETKPKERIDIALLKNVLSLCLTFFPKIFLNVLPDTGKVLNAIPFELYQEPKVTEPDNGDIKPKDIKPKEVGLEDIKLFYQEQEPKVTEPDKVGLGEDIKPKDIDIENYINNILKYYNGKNKVILINGKNKVILINGKYSLLYDNGSLLWNYSEEGYTIQYKISMNRDLQFIPITHRGNVITLLKNANKTLKLGGKKNTTVYKLNGDEVFLIHNNRKIKRCIYIKGNGKTKYCKINKVFISLSKLKNKIIE
jgi:hypothetical protein